MASNLESLITQLLLEARKQALPKEYEYVWCEPDEEVEKRDNTVYISFSSKPETILRQRG